MARDTPYAGPAWQKLRLKILARDGNRCQIRLPGCTVKAEAVDHVVPWRYGGEWYDPANLRAACTRCNTARSNRRTPSRPSREW
jgi:5-methylcytosine-specific restriction endonuclease McrA